jgi:hypothetical protein
MRAASLPLPSPFITADVELGFRWKKADGFASASFAEDGHIIAFCREPGRDTALRMDQPFAGSDLTALFAGIRRLA